MGRGGKRCTKGGQLCATVHTQFIRAYLSGRISAFPDAPGSCTNKPYPLPLIDELYFHHARLLSIKDDVLRQPAIRDQAHILGLYIENGLPPVPFIQVASSTVSITTCYSHQTFRQYTRNLLAFLHNAPDMIDEAFHIVHSMISRRLALHTRLEEQLFTLPSDQVIQWYSVRNAQSANQQKIAVLWFFVKTVIGGADCEMTALEEKLRLLDFEYRNGFLDAEFDAVRRMPGTLDLRLESVDAEGS